MRSCGESVRLVLDLEPRTLYHQSLYLGQTLEHLGFLRCFPLSLMSFQSCNIYQMLTRHHCSKPNYMSISLSSRVGVSRAQLFLIRGGQSAGKDITKHFSSLCSVPESSLVPYLIPEGETQFVDFSLNFILRATKELAQKTRVGKVLWRCSPSLHHFINLSSETTFEWLGLIKSFCMQLWKEPISPFGLFLHLIWVEHTHFLRINYNCF